MNQGYRKSSKPTRYLLQGVAFVLGVAAGTFLFFQILFLMKVIPHGGL